jgi:trk system potassium uptake protein TrkH
MAGDWHDRSHPALTNTRHRLVVRWLERSDATWIVIGTLGVMLNHAAYSRASEHPPWEFGLIVVLAMAALTASFAFRYAWSLARVTFRQAHGLQLVLALAWVAGMAVITILGPVLPDWGDWPASRWRGFVLISEVLLVVHTGAALLVLLRSAAAEAFNPAHVLVGSFAALIIVGTLLLTLPRSRAQQSGAPVTSAPLVTALFTATSASCVTGLIVEDTRTYWSRDGQTVILVLIQFGGLGIMTFGAFFGLLAGRRVGLRETATLQSLLDSEGLGSARQLLLTILCFTFGMELLGAFALSGLWADQPPGERIFQSVFHSVSAFCNAGFALTANSFVGQAHRWQVWGVITAQIILGGLGFAVVRDVFLTAQAGLRLRRRPRGLVVQRSTRRITLSTRLVLQSTVALLACGMVGLYLLERASQHEAAARLSLWDAWFQSVTFRTAGFNTVDYREWGAATKLLAILLMFIGASPGSTGGGVKTTVFAIAVIGLASVMRGRQRVECYGRTLPDLLVHRSLVLMFLSMVTIMTTTLLIVLYENRSEHFVDYLFESASAVGTVGVSSGLIDRDGELRSVTQSLSTRSRLVIIVAMFLGRVGPLTLLLALAGSTTTARYYYPEERVTLG